MIKFWVRASTARRGRGDAPAASSASVIIGLRNDDHPQSPRAACGGSAIKLVRASSPTPTTRESPAIAAAYPRSRWPCSPQPWILADNAAIESRVGGTTSMPMRQRGSISCAPCNWTPSCGTSIPPKVSTRRGHPTAVDSCWAGRPWALGSQPPEMLVSHRAFGDPMPLTLSQPGPVLSEESWLKVRTL